MSDFESARVRDYSKNIKTLSAKYYYDQELFKPEVFPISAIKQLAVIDYYRVVNNFQEQKYGITRT